MEKGDKVIIKGEENPQIVYVIVNIIDEKSLIKGLTYRVSKVVDTSLLILASDEMLNKEIEIENNYLMKLSNIKIRNKKFISGKILHIDGDKEYLDKCMMLYDKIGIYAIGANIEEEKMAEEIVVYLEKVKPDVVVITGHDLYNGDNIKDLNNYGNTKNFIKTIKTIRGHIATSNAIIIAGACQSNFEALIASGADFASSPKRINVHTFDPAVIAVKSALTSIVKVISLDEALKYIENGKDAYGGLETLGKMRLIL